jgi:hypothetical protein
MLHRYSAERFGLGLTREDQLRMAREPIAAKHRSKHGVRPSESRSVTPSIRSFAVAAWVINRRRGLSEGYERDPSRFQSWSIPKREVLCERTEELESEEGGENVGLKSAKRGRCHASKPTLLLHPALEMTLQLFTPFVTPNNDFHIRHPTFPYGMTREKIMRETGLDIALISLVFLLAVLRYNEKSWQPTGQLVVCILSTKLLTGCLCLRCVTPFPPYKASACPEYLLPLICTSPDQRTSQETDLMQIRA